VVPNAIGPEGMRLGGPSLAPVGVNKHRLCGEERRGEGRETQRQQRAEERERESQTSHDNTRLSQIRDVCVGDVWRYAYVVAFSQEVKCKSISFRCCEIEGGA